MTILDRFKQIQCFAFDVDGVLTDGSLLVMDNGELVRKMNIKDGYALQLAVKMGYRVLVISGGTSEAVRERLHKLGVEDVFLRVEDKERQLREYLQARGLSPAEVLFMGDDIPDLGVMKLAGLPCCPSDAAPEIRHCSLYISPARGGEGCVRDVIEKVLQLNGHWNSGPIPRSQ